MSNISLSSSVRSALSSIQSSQAAAAIQQTRLATGKKVNSALDNPANFFTASGLNNRASDLNRLLDGIGLGIKTVEAADKGLKAITKLVETAQGAARQALQNASTNLSSTGSALVGGATKVATGTDAGAFSVTAGSTTTSVTIASGDTVQKVVDSLNAEGTGLRAEVGSDNKLKISALNGEALSIDAASADGASAFLGQTEGAVTRTAANTNTVRKDLAKQFDDLRTQIDQLARDSGFNGLNLLNGDSIKLQYNESNTSSQTVKGVTFDSTGLGIAASTNSLQSDSSINAGLANLEKAVTSLRSQASTFGSNLAVAQNRQDFTKGLIDTLQTGADGLVLADANEEGAKLLSLNTRSQLGNTALSLASQAEQGVLRLF
ncbi:MAG: flagellin [Bosea sp. (in: a-proteobacteria)]